MLNGKAKADIVFLLSVMVKCKIKSFCTWARFASSSSEMAPGSNVSDAGVIELPLYCRHITRLQNETSPGAVTRIANLTVRHTGSFKAVVIYLAVRHVIRYYV